MTTSNSVISIIKGGLGNQLFTYAAGRAMALRLDRDFYIDPRRGYTHDGYGRSYRLDRFEGMQAAEMPESWRVAPTLKHPKHKWIRAWNKLLPRDLRSYLAQDWKLPATQLTERHPRRGRVLIHGYWQDEKYFSDHAVAIRAELQPPLPQDARNQELGARLAAKNTVFVHARRVRYPVLLPPDYYRIALEKIHRRIDHPTFAVFSDDLQWTRDHIDFGDSPVQWVEHNPDDELADFWLMTCCKHAIIANSSFSWWGAWLGIAEASERVICAPAHPKLAIPPANHWTAIPFEPQSGQTAED